MQLTEEQKQLVKEIFDNKLDNKDNKDDTILFENLIDTSGVMGCMELCSKIKYDREKEIINKAIESSFKAWLVQPQPKIEYAFGCRDPKSQVNTWSGAFVICKTVDSNNITAAHFENNMDYIGHPKRYNDAIISYNMFIKRGWLPMSKEDLEKTAGITIDRDTKIHPLKQQNLKKWFFLGFGSAMLTLIICKYK